MRGRFDPAALEAELEDALMNALMGDPWCRALQGRLETVARAVLLRHGLAQARVQVSGGRGAVEVVVALPPQQARVREIRLSFGGL